MSHLQSLIWNMADMPRPIPFKQIEYRYERANIGLKPIYMTEDAIKYPALHKIAFVIIQQTV